MRTGTFVALIVPSGAVPSGHRRIGSAETTLSSNQMTGAPAAFDEVPAVREADTDPGRMVREDIFERPSYVTLLSPYRPNSRTERSPIITDDWNMLVRSIGRKQDAGTLSDARRSRRSAGPERTGTNRAPRSTIAWTIVAVRAARVVTGLLLVIGHYP